MSAKFYLSRVYGEQYLQYSASLAGVEETSEFQQLFNKLGSTATPVFDRDGELWFAIHPPIPNARLAELGRTLAYIASQYGSDNDVGVFYDHLPEDMQFEPATPPNNVVTFVPRDNK